MFLYLRINSYPIKYIAHAPKNGNTPPICIMPVPTTKEQPLAKDTKDALNDSFIT